MKEQVLFDWTPTVLFRHDPWRVLKQLWVRVRLVEHPPDNEVIRQEEVVDAEWRLV